MCVCFDIMIDAQIPLSKPWTTGEIIWLASLKFVASYQDLKSQIRTVHMNHR
jgi:hypothetical protein